VKKIKIETNYLKTNENLKLNKKRISRLYSLPTAMAASFSSCKDDEPPITIVEPIKSLLRNECGNPLSIYKW